MKKMGNDVNKPIKFGIFYEGDWEEREKCGKWDQTCRSNSKNHSYDAM